MDDTWKYIIQDYRRLLQSVDTWFATSIEQHGRSISCRGGCSECCRGLFDITLLDAWYLRLGFDLLPEREREKVLGKARERVSELCALWPEYSHPYLLNHRPDREWAELMPEEDETPCVLLDESGHCLIYEHRPMSCRLHGLPLVDLSGEVIHDEWCTLNFVGEDPLVCPGLRGDFPKIFKEEVAQFRRFTLRLVNKEFNELDTFIPAALLIDFTGFDWIRWSETARIVLNDPV